MGEGGGLRKNPFRVGGMDIFWNYTLQIMNTRKANRDESTANLPVN